MKTMNADAGFKCLVIGGSADDFRIDLFDGIGPEVIADILVCSMPSLGVAATRLDRELLRAGFVVAQVYELTADGLEDVKRSATRLYSLSFVNEVLQSVFEPEGRLFKVVDAIHRAAAHPEHCKAIACLLGDSFLASIKFLSEGLFDGYSDDAIKDSLDRIQQLLRGEAK